MHYLIDGHNLIAKIPDIDLSDPDDEAQLILRLKRWTLADRRRRATVYFDGGLPGGRSPHFSDGKLEVIFAPAGRAADELIIRRVRGVHNPPEFTVVSSDREILDAAERRRMPSVPSETFAGKLQAQDESRAEPPEPAPEASKKEEPLLSEEEVAEWLQRFGEEPDPERAQNIRRQIQRQRRYRRREQRKRRAPGRPADELKDSGTQLTEDEVEEWLDVFREVDDE